MKKVFQLHDKFTEEIIGSVIINDSQTDQLLKAWEIYHSKHNSNSEAEADIIEFETTYGELIGFEIIEIDFIQL